MPDQDAPNDRAVLDPADAGEHAVQRVGAAAAVHEDVAAGAAVGRLEEAVAVALAAIDAARDAHAAFRAASRVIELLQAAEATAARYRAHAAVRVRDQEKLSLAKLAQVLQVSKSRTQQFVQVVEAGGESATPSPSTNEVE